MDRIGPFEKLTEYGGEALPDGVFVALHAEPYATDHDRAWIMSGPSPWLQHLAQFYLCVSYPSAKNRTNGGLEERFRRMRYNDAVKEITRITIQSALNVLPQRLGTLLPSRMDELVAFNTFSENEPVALLEIARGGSWVSQLGQKDILPTWVDVVGRLYAAAQRTVRRRKATVRFTLKGACSLTDVTLIVLEQALATGTTISEILPKVLQPCKSEPKRLIVAAYNASTDGIMRIKREYPDALVLVVILHAGVNQHGYLIHPGCGDVGRMDAGIPDEL